MLIKKNWIIILILIIAVGILLTSKYVTPTANVDKYIEKIDSLQSQIDSISTIKDSIDRRIDTITITIEKTHIQYEKNRRTILNNTTSEDYLFFSNYIKSNKSRLDSINNF